MSLVNRIVAGLGGARELSTLANPSETLRNTFLGGDSFSGKAVSVDTALTLIPVWSASSLVASAVGGVPLKVFNTDRIEATASRQWRLLHDEPNDEMAADELWELVAHHLLLWGNAFLLKERDRLGIVQALWPIRPSRVTLGKEKRGNRMWRYFLIDGQERPRYYEDDILHIRGLSSDGFVGYSPVQLARQALGAMLAQEEFQGRFWSNGTFQGAALTHPGEMSAPAQQRLRKQIQSKRGVAEANGIWVFEEDMKYQNLGMPLRDAEFVSQAKLSRLAIAEIFGLVPPHRWGTEDANLTYANVGAAGSEFVRWTGRKWWKRIEKSLMRDEGIFPKPGPTLKAEFDTSDLERGDTIARYQAYEIGLNSGLLVPNEPRQWENLPPLPGGDSPSSPTPPSEPPVA